MRTFVLDRTDDLTGVSGTGVVAEGVEFSDGTVAIRWLGDRPSTVIHDNIQAVEAIHGHAGRTKILWTVTHG